MLKQVKITRKFHNHMSQIDLPSTLAILIVYLSPKQAQMGTTVAGVLVEKHHICLIFTKEMHLV